jgi:hypothetical protein
MSRRRLPSRIIFQRKLQIADGEPNMKADCLLLPASNSQKARKAIRISAWTMSTRACRRKRPARIALGKGAVTAAGD